MEKFSFSGLWKHAGSTYIAAGISIADVTLSYLGIVALPNWAHALVGIAVLALSFYKGKLQPPELKAIP